MNDKQIFDLNLSVTDPNLDRKKAENDTVQYHNGLPLPSIVEISESGTCNRSCSFCPRSAKNFQDIKEFVSDTFVVSLAKQLAEINYSGLVLFSGFVEPLLDKNIAQHVATIKSVVPRCRVEMVTNGDPITVKNLNKLSAANLDKLLVSCYDGEHQITELTELIEQSTFSINDVVFRPRWAGEEENFGISLSNRGGTMEGAEFSIGSLESALKIPCYYPAYTFFVDYTGEVLMCAHDWGKKAVVGNLNESSFLEIWGGPIFSEHRRRLIKGDRDFSPCDVCNVQGTRMGRAHAKEWRKSSVTK